MVSRATGVTGYPKSNGWRWSERSFWSAHSSISNACLYNGASYREFGTR